jgi:hypothetical protein
VPPRLQEPRDRDFQGVREPLNVVKGYVSLTALDRTDVRPVQSCTIRERFLRQPELPAECPQVVRENLA